MLEPRRINIDIVNGVANGVNIHPTTLFPLTPFPVNKTTVPLAKMGKRVEDVAVIRNLPQAAFVNSLD